MCMIPVAYKPYYDFCYSTTLGKLPPVWEVQNVLHLDWSDPSLRTKGNDLWSRSLTRKNANEHEQIRVAIGIAPKLLGASRVSLESPWWPWVLPFFVYCVCLFRVFERLTSACNLQVVSTALVAELVALASFGTEVGKNWNWVQVRYS